MIRTLLAGILLFSATAAVAAPSVRPEYTVNSMAELRALDPRSIASGTRLSVGVLGKTNAGDWGARRSFFLVTNAVTDDGVFEVTNSLGGWRAADKDSPVIDPRWFGLVMTNTVDSSAALQAAIDHGAETEFYPGTGSRGVTVQLPPGILLIAQPVRLKPGTRLVGSGNENTVVFTTVTNADTIYYEDEAPGITVAPEVRSLTINMVAGYVATSGAALHFFATPPGNSVSPVVRDVTVRGTYRGVVLDTTFQAVLDHVRAYSCIDDGFRIEESGDGVNSTSTTFLSCYAAANGGDGYDLIGDYHALTGCASDSNGGVGYRGNRSTSLYTLSNVSFLSCGAEANLLGGGYLLGAFGIVWNCTVYGVDGTGHGLTIDSGTGITVSGRMSGIGMTNRWAVFLTNGLGYDPYNVVVQTDAISTFGLGTVSDWSKVSHAGGAWKGTYPSIEYGTKPTSLPAGITHAPSLAGDGTYNIGLYSTPNFSSSAAGFSAGEYVVPRYGFSGSQTLAAARIVAPPSVSSGSVAYQVGDWIQTTTNGTSSDIGIWLGSSFPPAGDFSIAATTTNEARFAGLLSGGTVRSTDAAGTTKAELTSGGFVLAPFFASVATNLATTRPILDLGSGTRYTDASAALVAASLDAWFSPGTTENTAFGLDVAYRANPDQRIGTVYGLHLHGYGQTTGSVAALYGIGLDASVTGGSTVGNAAGTVIFQPTIGVGSAITNLFGLLILDQVGASNNWAIYTGAGRVRFGDDTTIASGKSLTVGNVTRTNWPSSIADISGLQTELDGKQPLDADLTVIAGASGASNLVTLGDYSGHHHATDRARTNHTGTQAISTVDGLQAALDLRQLTNANLTTLSTRDGSILTNLNGSEIRSGTVADARIDSALLRDAEAAALYQPSSPYLTDIAGMTGVAGTMLYFDGSDLQPFGIGSAGQIAMATNGPARPVWVTPGTAAWRAVPASGNASSAEVVIGSDTRLSDSRTPTSHTHPSSEISDSTSAGRSLLTAASASAQRSSLGLGTLATINDATSDGSTYGRKDGAWVVVTNSGSGGGGSGGTNVPVAITLLSSTASTTVTNSTTNQTSLIPSVTANSQTNIPANSLGSGAVLRMRAHGTFSSSGANFEGTLRFKVGGYTASVQLLEPSSYTPDGVAWSAEANVQVVTSGASATVRSWGTLGYQSAPYATANEVGMRHWSGSGSLDTTATANVDVTWENSSGSPVNWTASGVVVEVLGQTISVGASGSTKTIFRWNAEQGFQPASNPATFSSRNTIGVMEFDPSIQEAIRFRSTVPEGTTAATATVIVKWTTSATSGDGRWGAKFWALTGDIDSDSFATAVEGTTTTSGTAGTIMTTTLTAVGLDSAAAGDGIVLEIYRDVGDAADTINSNDLQLHTVEVRAE